MKRPKPLLLVVDFQQSESSSEFPAGRPVVTELRPMRWWERLGYSLRGQLRPRKTVSENLYVPDGPDVSIELSEAQFVQLVLGTHDTSHTMRCLQGTKPQLRLVLPAKHDTNVPTEEVAGL